ncbi:hypothetical protein C8J56DRAFT_937119 [Mycena floridula]|nr:hypothetical protein C8J56DRAFT_937119 [Mycena floridula]
MKFQKLISRWITVMSPLSVSFLNSTRGTSNPIYGDRWREYSLVAAHCKAPRAVLSAISKVEKGLKVRYDSFDEKDTGWAS